MTEYYTIKIAGLERKLPLCPLNEDLNIAGFVILGDWEMAEACAKLLAEKAPQYDYLITAESKGIPLVNEMAKLKGDKKYFVARKEEKLYMTEPISVSVKSITTDWIQTLCIDRLDAEQMKGKRILLIDDVISTGASIYALEELVKAAGGIVCGRMTILAEGDAADRDDIIYLEKLPLFDKDNNPI